eukprot:scaffold104570_cov16-Tisochrysis_lutea.AAC.1
MLESKAADRINSPAVRLLISSQPAHHIKFPAAHQHPAHQEPTYTRTNERFHNASRKGDLIACMGLKGKSVCKSKMKGKEKRKEKRHVGSENTLYIN